MTTAVYSEATGAATVVSERPTPATEALLDRYRAYRLGQGRGLLQLLPREGLRAVVRAARPRIGIAPGAEVSLDLLAEFCADLLPLPPLDVWMSDFQEHRAAHLADTAPAEAGPRSPDGTPVVVALRQFRFAGGDWVGQLHVWPHEGRWEGAVQFHGPGENRVWRTASIFREDSVGAVRERYGAFDDSTLCAFLRSALP